MFLGTYSYGLYVYHHFISYYLTVNHTERVLTAWLGSHGAAIALQATLGRPCRWRSPMPAMSCSRSASLD